MPESDMDELSPTEGEAGGGMPTPPPPPIDEENPALVDAFKTYRYTVLGALGFAAAALFIILSTRWG